MPLATCSRDPGVKCGLAVGELTVGHQAPVALLDQVIGRGDTQPFEFLHQGLAEAVSHHVHITVCTA